MARLFLSLLLFSGMASACPALLDMLSHGQHIAPISLMKQMEDRFSGVISDFSVDVDDAQLVYQIEIINPKTKSLIELSVLAENGEIIKHKHAALKEDDADKLIVAKHMEAKKLAFSTIVQESMQNYSSQLIDAELDHDLGINYLELELLSDNGNHKFAFDVDQGKPLPLLTWD